MRSDFSLKIPEEYSILNIYENFGGGDLRPVKFVFGVVVIRVFLVVRASIPGLCTLTLITM